MTKTITPASPYIKDLKDRIDITRVPFSDRGSRLLVFAQPDESRLYIKLAERLTSIQPGVESYLSRPPFIQDLCFVNVDGSPLEYGLTTYPHALMFETRLGMFSLSFQRENVLAVGLPPAASGGIRFRVQNQMRMEDEDGGALLGLRDLSYRTNGHVRMNTIEGKQDGQTITFIVDGGDDLAIHLGIGSVSSDVSDRSLNGLEPAPVSKTLAAAETRWHDWFSRAPAVDERFREHYYYAWWVMGSSLINPLGQVQYEAMMPAQSKYVGIWNWDSCFHALAFRHIDVQLARNQLRTILAAQLPNGMIPDVVYDEGIVAELNHPIRAEVTKPPVIAWAALKLDEFENDTGFLGEIYEPLLRWNAWWFSMNDDDADGLAQYNHPYSSGLDDNPLWDYGMPVEAPDLNTYLCIQMDSLAAMAQALGKSTQAAMWKRRSRALTQRMIEDMWDEEAGVFRATHMGQSIPVVTPFNLYPLWTNQLPERIRDRLIAHLRDPEKFWGAYVLPSVARNDPHYAPDVMWRGPVWININYIFIEALEKAREYELANELLDKTLNLVMGQEGMYEYYHADTGEPPETAAPAFGWTSALFIDLAIRASHIK